MRRFLLVLAAAALVPASASAAAKRPDLKVSKVSAGTSVAQGAQLEVKATVANKGTRKARATRVGYFLSSDAKRDKADVRLSAVRKVKALKPGRRQAAKKQVTVPGSVAPGSYRLIVCADVSRKLKERSERNNCRAAKKPVAVTSLPEGPLPGPSGPPPGGTPAPVGTPTFPLPSHPLSVTTTLDAGHAVTGQVSSAGGQLTTTTAGGTRYTLAVPRGALVSAQNVTLTPVAQVGDLPLSGGLVGAVQITPHGLELLTPATLTIEPPSEAPVAAQTGFLYHEGGSDFHLHPLDGGRTLKLHLTHFSTPGVGLATAADRAAMADHMPARTQGQYEQLIAELLAAERRHQLLGEPGDPEFHAKLTALVIGYYDDVVKPRLAAAETDDSLAASAIAEALGWARSAELLGLTDAGYTTRRDDMWERIERVLRNAVNKANERCLDHELENIVRLVALERTAQLLGLDLGAPLELARKCAHFEVAFDSKLTSTDAWTAGDGRTFDLDATWRTAVRDTILDITGIGQGVLGWAEFSYQALNTYPCSDGGTLYSHREGVDTTDATVTAALQLDLNPRETAPGAPPPPPPDGVLLLYLGQPKERYRFWNDGCTSTDPTVVEESDWYQLFGSFHTGESPLLKLPVTVAGQNGDLLAAKGWNRQRGGRDPSGAGSARETEFTTLELWHRPAP